MIDLVHQNFDEPFLSKIVVGLPVATLQVVYQYNIDVYTKLSQAEQ